MCQIRSINNACQWLRGTRHNHFIVCVKLTTSTHYKCKRNNPKITQPRNLSFWIVQNGNKPNTEYQNHSTWSWNFRCILQIYHPAYHRAALTCCQCWTAIALLMAMPIVWFNRNKRCSGHCVDQRVCLLTIIVLNYALRYAYYIHRKQVRAWIVLLVPHGRFPDRHTWPDSLSLDILHWHDKCMGWRQHTHAVAIHLSLSRVSTLINLKISMVDTIICVSKYWYSRIFFVNIQYRY